MESQNGISEMEPLITNRWLLTWLCVYSAARTTSELKKIGHIVFAVTVVFGLMCGTVSHFVYFLKFISTDLEGALVAFMGFTTFFALEYIMIVIYSERSQVTAIFEQLSHICENRK